jgi:hypothetical protein|tara:strand:- start:253 stop:1131 length:879 start_codon:yes stop_codon:yes gene_type:complete
MKKVKHSKFKNTGILFELLVRQITLEVLNGDTTEKAKYIVKEFFSTKTELNKEHRLYELLQKEKYNSESRAEKFIDTINEAHSRINQSKLQKEKYNLIKKINESFNMDDFLSSPITNYKVLASIYKIFEAKNMGDYDVKDIFNSKITLIENITSKPSVIVEKMDDAKKLVESYKKQDKDLRLLTYKILVETFNKKYSNLDESQKQLLKQFINNITNTTKFKEYVEKEIPSIVKELKVLHKSINDKVTKIKLAETVSVLNKTKIGKTVSDNHVSSLMISYELIKELKGKLNEK